MFLAVTFDEIPNIAKFILSNESFLTDWKLQWMVSNDAIERPHCVKSLKTKHNQNNLLTATVLVKQRHLRWSGQVIELFKCLLHGELANETASGESVQHYAMM